jgi:hypothetical protein
MQYIGITGSIFRNLGIVTYEIVSALLCFDNLRFSHIEQPLHASAYIQRTLLLCIHPFSPRIKLKMKLFSYYRP